jgi:membrane fusion protein (multidrug efflux system)
LNDITRSVQVRGELVNPKDEKGNYLLRPGMLLSLQIQLESKDMIAVPEKSVQSLGEIQYIFILNDENVAETREIVPGIRRDGKVEILSGASANERFVLEGINKVRNGMKVRLLGAEEK